MNDMVGSALLVN